VKIIYSPKDGERREFTFTPDDLGPMEAEAVEEAGGVQWRTYGQWIQLLMDGGARAWRVVLWVLLRRTDPKLDLNEVQPTFQEVSYIYDENENLEQQEPGKDEPEDSDTDST
jgi:hypothetical protein